MSRRKLGKSLEEEKKNSSSQWAGQIKIYTSLALESCQLCQPGSESEGCGESWNASSNQYLKSTNEWIQMKRPELRHLVEFLTVR
ncbi:uncharacterized protein LOC143669143 isoform X2 [Tamandua tetradactyla]|uniref:uncharacterized protein LOC143669143 isoform X2 n=1 Tax=Tamandua tetradactyla TaxID=48850 RepID=UPI0040537FC0